MKNTISSGRTRCRSTARTDLVKQETASCTIPKIPPTPTNSNSFKYFVYGCELNLD